MRCICFPSENSLALVLSLQFDIPPNALSLRHRRRGNGVNGPRH